MQKPQVGIASVWYEGNTCNMHLDRAGRQGQGRRRRGRHGRHAVQHHRRQRRHLDGHRGHELLAAIARPDRRFDRNRDARPVVRRQHLHSRLRQEHARLPDRDGPPESAGADGLRRHDQAGAPGDSGKDMPRGSSTSSRRFNVTANTWPAGSTRAHAQDRSCKKPVPAPAPAAACTRPTRWPRPSKRWACRCRTARRFRRKIPASSTSAFAPAPPFAICWSATSSRATS